MYFSQGRWEQALEFYNKVLDLDPVDDAAILNRGITKAQLGKLDEALDDINAAAEGISVTPEVFFNRAQLLQKMGQYDLADSDYSRVLSMVPDDITTFLKRGEA